MENDPSSENPYRRPDNEGDSPGKKRGKFWLTLFLVLGIGGLLVGLLLPARRSGREPRRTVCLNNLKQIALALRNYEAVHHELPPAYTVDADGKPLHSWRTLILPYVEEQQLYETIDLSKPWNDSANAKAYKTAVPAFRCPSADCPENHTVYLASVAPNGCFRLTEPRNIADITDDLAKTLLVIEVAPEQAVHWMSPMDANESLVMGLGPDSHLAHPGGKNAAFCGGNIRFLSEDTSAEEWRALISIAGNDKSDIESLD